MNFVMDSNVKSILNYLGFKIEETQCCQDDKYQFHTHIRIIHPDGSHLSYSLYDIRLEEYFTPSTKEMVDYILQEFEISFKLINYSGETTSYD